MTPILNTESFITPAGHLEFRTTFVTNETKTENIYGGTVEDMEGYTRQVVLGTRKVPGDSFEMNLFGFVKLNFVPRT